MGNEVYYVQNGAGERIEGPFESKREAQHVAYKKQRALQRLSTSVEVVENSEATETDADSDDNTTMSYATIVSDSDEQNQTNNDDSQQFGTFDWGYGDHTGARETDLKSMDAALDNMMDDLDGEVDDDMVAVLEDASELVSDIKVTDFECSHPDCGLSHGHGDDKHDIRNSVNCAGIEGFNITDEFAEQMEFVPNCHCGANEAAMLMPFLHHFSIPMFDDQHEFEGVLEMDEDVVHDIYRTANEVDKSIEMAVGEVAARRGLPESEMAPLGLRDDLEAYIERRRHVESGADAAPIGQETQTTINQNRDELEKVTGE